MSFRVIRVLLTTSCFATFAMVVLAVEPIAADKRARHPAQAPAFMMADSGCDGLGNLADVQCQSRYLEWLNGRLKVAYSAAMKRLPATGASDARKEQEQLRKSQQAWAVFYQENCALEGGLEGGSNLWVTHFASLCEERELKARIAFLHGVQP